MVALVRLTANRNVMGEFANTQLMLPAIATLGPLSLLTPVPIA